MDEIHIQKIINRRRARGERRRVALVETPFMASDVSEFVKDCD